MIRAATRKLVRARITTPSPRSPRWTRSPAWLSHESPAEIEFPAVALAGGRSSLGSVRRGRMPEAILALPAMRSRPGVLRGVSRWAAEAEASSLAATLLAELGWPAPDLDPDAAVERATARERNGHRSPRSWPSTDGLQRGALRRHGGGRAAPRGDPSWNRSGWALPGARIRRGSSR